jgi:hypothetical protein
MPPLKECRTSNDSTVALNHRDPSRRRIEISPRLLKQRADQLRPFLHGKNPRGQFTSSTARSSEYFMGVAPVEAYVVAYVTVAARSDRSNTLPSCQVCVVFPVIAAPDCVQFTPPSVQASVTVNELLEVAGCVIRAYQLTRYRPAVNDPIGIGVVTIEAACPVNGTALDNCGLD